MSCALELVNPRCLVKVLKQNQMILCIINKDTTFCNLQKRRSVIAVNKTCYRHFRPAHESKLFKHLSSCQKVNIRATMRAARFGFTVFRAQT
jgi:hypothetical protein